MTVYKKKSTYSIKEELSGHINLLYLLTLRAAIHIQFQDKYRGPLARKNVGT